VRDAARVRLDLAEGELAKAREALHEVLDRAVPGS
jgi:hypothetical protein